MKPLLGILIAMATLHAGTEQILKVPDGSDKWFLVQTCGTAISILGSDHEQLEAVAPFVKSQWREYSGVNRVEVIESGNGCAKIRLVDKADEGWVSEKLLQNTPEEEKELARKHQAAAAQRAKQAAEQKKRDADLAKLKADEEAKATAEPATLRANCTFIYRNTADKRIGDLTVRESQQVQACQVLGLYPPK